MDFSRDLQRERRGRLVPSTQQTQLLLLGLRFEFISHLWFPSVGPELTQPLDLISSQLLAFLESTVLSH